MMSINLVTAFLALFTICNPIGTVPLFLSLTHKLTLRQQRLTAMTTALAVMIVLLISLFLGKAILNLFNIDLNAFKLAGETLIMTLAWSMIQAKPSRQRQTPEERVEATTKESVAVVPLAIPILAGPGSISTVIAYAGSSQNISTMELDTLVIILVSITVLIILWLSPFVQNLLGQTGMNVMTRIFGLLLLAIGVSGAVEAIKALFPLLAH